MIIQCRKCQTRFRFDENLMEAEGAWVRCSRCQNVFFQERPSASGTESPSVRISDTRRSAENRFPVSEGTSSPNEIAEVRVDIPLQREEEDKEPRVAFDKGSSMEGLERDLGDESPGRPKAGVGDEEEAAGPKIAPKRRAGRRRWVRTIFKLIAFLVLLAIAAGAGYLALFPEDRTQVLKWASPWLRSVPYLENLVVLEKNNGVTALAPVRVRVDRQRSVSNLFAGNLGVIEGVAVNQSSYPLAKIQVRLVVADAYDVVLGDKTVFCGNLLTDAELGSMAEADIQKELSIPLGSDVSNERIAPNGEIPFMIVFAEQQAGPVKTTVTPAGFDRVP
jgi:predicted Zn finger-like uncharacterized protein